MRWTNGAEGVLAYIYSLMKSSINVVTVRYMGEAHV